MLKKRTRQVCNLFQDLWNNPFWVSKLLKRVQKCTRSAFSKNKTCSQTDRIAAELVKGEFLGKSRGPKFLPVKGEFLGKSRGQKKVFGIFGGGGGGGGGTKSGFKPCVPQVKRVALLYASAAASHKMSRVNSTGMDSHPSPS